MSIRDAILGILTVGPAYGHQVLLELQNRLPHRGTINPGQVYSTINRLRDGSLIVEGGLSPENLPLYQLSPTGRDEAENWLSGQRPIDMRDWIEVLDAVMLSLSLPASEPRALILRLRSSIETTSRGDGTGLLERSPVVMAAWSHHDAAIASWLSNVEEAIESQQFAPHGFLEDRPGRGRRPRPRAS